MFRSVPFLRQTDKEESSNAPKSNPICNIHPDYHIYYLCRFLKLAASFFICTPSFLFHVKRNVYSIEKDI